DLKVRPIHHRLEDRVRAHIFLCMLAYYVEWHMLEAWRPLLFADEDQEAKAHRDPVAPAKRSEQALQKVLTHYPPGRHSSTQLPHPARGPLEHRAQHLPRARPPRALRHLRSHYHAYRQAAPRPGVDRH
ncbi:hypothetical protein B1A_04710, partial [mine drainage metagenome]